MKSLYSILVMAVCLVVCLTCGLNLYAYWDLGLKFGTGGCLYALVLMLAGGLLTRTLIGLLKNMTAKR